MAESDPGRLLAVAGMAAWAVAGTPTIAPWVSSGSAFDLHAVVWCVAYAVFAIGFWLTTVLERLAPRWRTVTLAGESVSALVVCGLSASGFEGVLLCVVAGQVPLLLTARPALAWVVAQTVGLLAVHLIWPLHIHHIFVSTAAYGGFQLFAFGAARLAAREAAARRELARVNAELLATQEMFADSARTAERLRIARELHDALGHHLMALSLQLEVSRNVAEGRAKEPVEHAHQLAKGLVAELRAVVGAMREDPPVALSRALRTLVAGIPRPTIHLTVADDLDVDPGLAHTIFRCAQEALTNAVRHADAENVYLEIAPRDGSISVVARDDGRGANSVHAGHGLTGLRERIEALGGEFEIDGGSGEGFTLRALLPTPRSAP